ncbi:MAG: Bug family tripartite tricarboxylate transporter substrate binding protein [Pigmentiphaga sp.]
MFKLQRRHALAALGSAALALACGSAVANTHDSYPNKAIRLIVPLPPGSPPDVLARVVSERLQAAWGHPVVVENRPGATGMIGLDAVARAAPDGYTMGIMFMTHTVLPSIFRSVSYDTATAFSPVANLVWLYNVLVVHPSVAAGSLQELIETASANPGSLTYASGGNGSPAHLIGESFRQMTGVEIQHIPYRGPAEALNGLLAGDTSMMFATSSVAVPMVRAGKVKALAVTRPERFEVLADVPTLAEAGLPGFAMREWEGVVAPAGTPPAIIERWNRELARIMQEPEVRASLEALGMQTADANTPAEFEQLIQNELSTWAEVIRRSGIEAS